MNTFTRLESEVRSYCRSFPVVFTKAKGHELIDENEHHYIDFLAGAGALNYGHNNPIFKKRILEYIDSDSITHSLDLFTTAKRAFLEHFENAEDFKVHHQKVVAWLTAGDDLKNLAMNTLYSNVKAVTEGFNKI